MLWRRPISFLPFLLLLCFLALCPPQKASAQEGTLVGRVATTEGEHAEQVLVHLYFRGSPIQSIYTSSDGRFAFYQLMHNIYHIVIDEEGYQPIDRTIVVRPDLNPTTQIFIILHPRPKKVEDSDRPPDGVSGGNPHLVSAESYSKNFPPKAVKEFEAGMREAEKGKIEKALKHYRKSIEIAPDFYPAHNNLGAIYLSQKKFDEAEKSFRECIRLHEIDANAFFNLGNVYLLTERYAAAEEVLRRGLSRQPLSPLGLSLLGAVQLRLRQFPQAERSLLKARELDAGMASVRLELVNLYLMQQRREDAVREIRQFMTLFPDSPLSPKLETLLKELESTATR